VKSKFIGYFAGTTLMLIFASGAYYKYDHYGNDQPIPEHEISITGVPLNINTVMGEYRGKSYIIGYRILLSITITIRMSTLSYPLPVRCLKPIRKFQVVQVWFPRQPQNLLQRS